MTRGVPLFLSVVLFTAAAQQTPPAGSKVADLASLIEAGQYADAERAARTRLKEVEARGGTDSAPAADILDALVEALMRQGQGTAEAKAFAARAVRIREHGATESGAYARSLNLLANIIELQGDITTARELYERAADTAMRTLGPSHSVTARRYPTRR